MEILKTLDDIVEKVKGKERRLVVAGGNAPTVIESIGKAVREKIIKATLIGDKEGILALSEKHGIDPSSFDIIEEKDPPKTAFKAVEFVREGKADFLMKGFISTAEYTRPILDKKNGLMGNSKLLTHVTVIQVPTYHKLMIISDIAILVSPDLSQKIAMLEFCIEIANRLGLKEPKAGIISCVEVPSYKIDSTIDGAIIKKLAKRAQVKGAVVDGPLAIDLAVSKRCAEEKKFESPVAGDCDILIFPDISSANVFFKTLGIFAGARIAGVVVGAQVPCILTSRADTEESKFVSIALGALLTCK
jgi:phosphate butyryltransferase